MTEGPGTVPELEAELAELRGQKIALENRIESQRRELAEMRQRLVSETERLRAAIIAADHARQREAAALTETRAMLRTLDRMLAADNDTAACEALVAEAAAALPGDGAMLLVQTAEGAAQVVAASDPAWRDKVLPVPTEWLERGRRIADLQRGGVDLGAHGLGGTAMILTPVKLPGSPPLALAGLCSSVGRFGPGDVQLLERLAHVSAQAFETLRQTRRSNSLAALINGESQAEGEPAGDTVLVDTPFVAMNSALVRVTRAQKVQLSVLTDLLQSDLDQKDAAINRALEQLGHLTGSDRTYVFRVDGDETVSNTHEWCNTGIAPAIGELQKVPLSIVDHWLPDMLAGRPISIADVEHLPENSSEKEILQMQGIRSLILVPMLADGRLTGFAGLDSVEHIREYLPGEVLALRAVASAIDNVMHVREMAARLGAARDAVRAERDMHLRVADLSREIEKTTGVGSWEYLPGDEWMLWSPKISDIFETPPDWRPRLADVLDMVDEAYQGTLKAATKGLFEGVGYDLTLPITTLRGEPRWLRLTGNAQIEDGRLLRLYGTCKDVTAQRLARRELDLTSEIARRTTNVIIVTGTDRRIEWVNPAFEVRTGYSLDEVRGRKPDEFLQFQNTDPATVQTLREALQKHQQVRVEIENIDRNGQPYWIDLEILPLTGPDGEPSGFLSVQTDITERRQQAAQLRDAAARAERMRRTLSDAVEALEDGFAFYDADDRLVVCNRKFRELVPQTAHLAVPGTSFEELLRAGIAVGAFPEAQADPEHYVADVQRRRALAHYVREIPLADGRWLRLVDHAVPDGGRVESAVDITALKQAEERALSERAEAMDASSDGIALNDQNGIITYMNPSLLAMFGYTDFEQVRGKHWGILYGDRLAEDLRVRSAADLRETGKWRGELLGETPSGLHVEHEIAISLRPDGGVLCIARDISERRRAEAERERLGKELEQAQRRELIGQMAAGLAHDFNNLLATISGSATLTSLALPQDHNARVHAERILSATEQANGLVRRLLNLGARKSAMVRTDLRSPLREASDLARAGMSAAIRLVTELPDTACMADADPTEVVQIVLNLAINARDALMPDGGTISISLTDSLAPQDVPLIGEPAPDSPYWRIRIADTGPGMSPEVMSQIFRPYFSTKGGAGSGLGLASVKSLVLAAGGLIRIDSAPGAGAVFDIYWPMTAGNWEETALDPQVPVVEPGAGSPPLAGLRILVVDDSEPLVEVLTGFLESAGAKVASTTDPLDALEVLSDDPGIWDILVTDFDMPGMNGAELARGAIARAPDLPVILVTALPDWQARGKGAHFSAVLGKPVTRKQLVAAALSVLGRETVG